MYVKAAVTYCGGILFGYAEDVEGTTKKLATTILAVMVKCFFTGKKFLAKLVPCHKLKADFMYTIVTEVIKEIETWW